MKTRILIGACVLWSTSLSAQVLPLTEDFSRAEPGEHLPGGATSHKSRNSTTSFLKPAKNLSFENRLDFRIGESIFAKLWVFSPSSTTASDGLGPLYNARSCMGCHIKGGRGHVPRGNWPEDNAISMLMRLSIPPQTEAQRVLLASGKLPFISEPTYGAQLQDFAVPGMHSEGRIHISYTERSVDLSGGQRVSLRQPSYKIVDLADGPLHPEVMQSVRLANPMIGLGLLEAIPEADLLALEDPEDSDGDGISGRANRVWDEAKQRQVLGRFGWKAGNPSLNQQNSAAFAGDMGLSTQLFDQAYNGDCTARQQRCLDMADGRSAHLDNLEVATQMTAVLDLFTKNIAVPARKDANSPDVLVGKRLFYSSGCAGCHQPGFVTSSEAGPEQASQRIWPYTDLLLHDMGEGLADNRPEYQASGREWRTAPLWALDVSRAVSGELNLLHDGRARSILEAILWHGGEAQASRETVRQMVPADREKLLRFLESL
ncbi:MAG: di-heme oxidoredictase family protein [Pseudomonadales bacterium]